MWSCFSDIHKSTGKHTRALCVPLAAANDFAGGVRPGHLRPQVKPRTYTRLTWRGRAPTHASMSRRANAVISFKLGKSFMVCPSGVGYPCNGVNGAKSNPILRLLPQREKSGSAALQTRLIPSSSPSAFTQAEAIGFSNTHDAKAKVPWKIS